MIKKILLLAMFAMSLPSIAQMDSCLMVVDFDYTMDGDSIYFDNTTSGGAAPYTYDWDIDGIIDDSFEPAVAAEDLSDIAIICLTVSDAAGCIASYCDTIYSDLDSSDCALETSFTYSVDGDMISFTNTSTGEPEFPHYNWSLEGSSGGTVYDYVENPSFYIIGMSSAEACLTIEDTLSDCADTYCMTIYFEDDSSDVSDSVDCALEANFTYTIAGDFIFFYNASTGEPASPSYTWNVGEYVHGTEDVGHELEFFESGDLVCLTVSDSAGTCVDTYCDTIYYDLDTADCTIEASFTYTVTEDAINLTNTSTGLPEYPYYAWSYSGGSGTFYSYEEDASFSTEGAESSVEVCLTIDDSMSYCTDTYCAIIYLDSDSSDVSDSMDCDIEASFTYSISGGTISFTNTSTGTVELPTYYWAIDGMLSYAENPSFSTAGFESSEEVCLTYYDSLTDCSDTYCTIIYFESDSSDVSDSTDCDIEAGFTYSISGGTISFTNTSTGTATLPTYYWAIDGLISFVENPSFSTADFESSEEVCLTYYDSLTDCSDTYCTIIYFDDDSSSTGGDSTASIIESSALSVAIYPNPASEMVTIELNNANSDQQIILTNTLGEIVRLEKLFAGNELMILDVSDLPNGIYILNIIDEETPNLSIQKKLIKK